MPTKPTNLLAQFLRPNIVSHKVGVVVSAGKMARAVKVRVAEQTWNKHMRKYFPSPRTYMVADPNSSLVEGDVVRITSGHRFSKQIHHVVTSIIAPFGTPVDQRPPVLTQEQLMQKRLEARLEKDVRSKERGRLTSIWRLKEARRAGYKIPDLETAMRNVKLEQEVEETEGEGNKEAHKGQVGQMATAKQRNRARGEKAKEEALAQEEVKQAKNQTVEKTVTRTA
ncbi:nucleic acid-binding protein [Westerdykella ornata]|uniref:Nucleic acid-binding protein n=1 Tax=Westerdykella ornata TaxID=318751 RepID=A0A6A6J801_WESOR|nr:nucleic acid-binding protein [Westerdykella ornata]KAF2272128.1 nucleic acid-binding protein [Westerdykella ornata]